MSLAKVPLLLIAVAGSHITLTPPNPRVPANERPKDVSQTEKHFSALAHIYATMTKLSMCAGSIVEIAVLLALEWPTHPLSKMVFKALIPGPRELADRITISDTFIIGCILTAAGALGRISCYRTLGRLFTFEVTIRNDHKLVTQGPYAYVRHPSYTSGLLFTAGVTVCNASRGSWAKECGVLDTTAGRLGACVYWILFFLGLLAVITRMPEEDRLLRDRFGAEWDRWAKKVPYRLVPCVY
ncbi:uncharacterized protein FIBRA_04236 [Fibroporia radiculosa]|uniref:Protein-S-isoprenylcysteine O-methyltransferase n=1 Tax=Fibroporia radiculosa TaxID=599839 RepID=J4G722_9APHY|nr:uncharacterized protein FIBRA_04236 [Fibroporia radiculosa]CCM02158.1 predicted protein [Fibroporia radiculosa]